MITKELTDWTLGANYPYVPVMTCAAENFFQDYRGYLAGRMAHD